MTNVIEKLNSLTTNEVVSVYSGKVGKCCCGCSGNHRYTAQGFAKLSKVMQSYSEVNESQVKRVLNILKQNAAVAEDGGSYLSVELGQRLYIVYLS